jgi:hypothetical protein
MNSVPIIVDYINLLDPIRTIRSDALDESTEKIYEALRSMAEHHNIVLQSARNDSADYFFGVVVKPVEEALQGSCYLKILKGRSRDFGVIDIEITSLKP